MPKFQRYALFDGVTWAYRRFKAHHTEINQLYWAFVPIASYGDYLARHTSQDTDPEVLFHAAGPDARRLAPTAVEWRRDFREFQNWVRLGGLVSAVAYLELYLRNTITLALRSDPLVRFGSSHLMDGVVWLKRGLRNDIETLVRECLVGEWPTRLRAYRLLFGTVPGEFTRQLAELEQMRKMRNAAGHAFGRNIPGPQIGILAADGGVAERLSQKRFLKWLGIVDEIAASVDRHLGLDHIGEFELLSYYHHWKSRPRLARERSYTEARAFSHEISRISGATPGLEFYEGLIAYYAAA